jgi:imidazole glycerol-phosphate synthase subunit HisH
MIVIVDYGLGNVSSIQNMLKHIGSSSVISADPAVIAAASRIILPGVGAFDNSMRNICAMGLLPVLNDKALKDRVPVLGICLGMQLLTERSEEGELPGLGWIKGETIRFRLPADSNLKVPHMGWNTVRPVKEHSLCRGFLPEQRYYFVHSYHVTCADAADVLMETEHGYAFASSVQSGNIMGTQFHPEKSHRFGMQLLKNFVEL